MTAIKTTAIRAVTDDPTTHTVALKQLKEIAELALRIRGNPGDSYVRVSELVDAGIARFENGNVVAANTALPTSAVPSSRLITTGTGLLGGGDLSADRTLTVDDSHWATVAFTGAYSDLSGTPTPVSPAALTKTDDTNVTLTLGGTPATALLHAASLTLGWTGTLAVSRGGSGAGTLTGYLKGNGTSAFTASATIPYSDLTGTPTIPSVPLTTKGDLLGFSTVDARVPVGTDTYVLTADSGAALGVSWQPAGAPTPAALTSFDDTNVTLSLGGSPSIALLQAASLSLGWTGTLAVARGGSGAGTLTGYLKGNGTSAFTASATIPYADISGTPTPSALTKTDDTNVTLTLGGTPATALLQAASLTLGWTGTLAVARGGTGAATLTGYMKGNGTSAVTAAATVPTTDLTGVLAAAQFPALTSDVTTVAGALAATIANDAVTYAKMQNVSATSRVLGRITAGAGDPEELTAANLSTILGLAAVATSGSASDLGTGTLPAGAFPTLTGDVTTAGGALATTIGALAVSTGKIAASAVTYAKIQNVSATSRILGRITAGAGVVEELTSANVSTILGLATVATSGSASDLGSGTLPAGAFPALTGDVTTSAGALGTTIANLAVSTGKIAAAAVTYAKIQNVSATSRILGRITAGAGSAEELTSANVKTILALASTDLSDFSTGTYTGTLTGCTTSPTITVRWVKQGSVVTLTIPGVSATSSTTACTITGALPAACQPATTKWAAVPLLLNNGSANLSGTAASITAGTSTITLANGGSSTGFTASGTKGVSSTITFTYDVN